MIKYIKLSLLFCFLISIKLVNAQETISASIQEIINTAQDESPDHLLAKTRQNNAYWQYVSNESFFKPQLGLNATIPQINRSISAITLPSGQQSFVNQSFMSNNIGLNLSQVVQATGGTIFVSSSLERLDLFNTDSQNASSSYLSAPIGIGFDQPLFAINNFKWNRKLSKINYEASKKRFVEERERIAFNAVNNFFDLYITKLNVDEARQNKVYLDSISTNAQGRFSVGRISETDLLQIQLSAKNADGTLRRLELEEQNKSENLRNFLGIQDAVEFNLSTPNSITLYEIDKEKALKFAYENRSRTEEFRLQLLNAERNLESAIKENGPSLRLNGSFGLTQSGNQFSDAYTNLLDRERISLTIDLPLADFGRRKAQKEIAKSNLELIQLQQKVDLVNFEREILVNLEQFELRRDQLNLSTDALSIADKRLDIAKKRFNIGKIDVTNLNIAIQEQQNAQQQYYSSLWSLWQAHYTIRNLTLFDFEKNEKLN